MRSYIEKAIENYVKPLILNYHNQYNKTERVEEVFYERTGRVLYKMKTEENHNIWPTNKEQMKVDKMYDEFEKEKS